MGSCAETVRTAALRADITRLHPTGQEGRPRRTGSLSEQPTIRNYEVFASGAKETRGAPKGRWLSRSQHLTDKKPSGCRERGRVLNVSYGFNFRIDFL